MQGLCSGIPAGSDVKVTVLDTLDLLEDGPGEPCSFERDGSRRALECLGTGQGLLLVAADGTYTLLHELRLLVWLELFRRERLLLHLGQAQRHGLLPFCALLRRHTLALAAQHRQPSGLRGKAKHKYEYEETVLNEVSHL